MLTCHFSVNERYATNNWNPLARECIQRLRDSDVRCIAVHGGMDEICPIDTAMELSDAWPEMELRIPIGAGHSMYHPSILHELVCATDRLAVLVEDRQQDAEKLEL
uniref:Prolyl aminopeptidase n=1 Tax=Cyclophora tenuis TaxID=216820 RepID=A0A7S1GP31_CYCTE|mmetsp:Transcript_9132/g.15318  ORF Transcript_9132/g.15318 Transcript_9132/m.15318 type:complete len:106 (+) Transcript_9132:1-318(+)